MRAEVREFNGKLYQRYPDSPRRNDRVYFSHSESGTTRLLHRDIWSHHNGPIPPGHHIHHIDFDPLNNDPSNLECLSVSEHVKKHWTEERHEKQLVHLDNIRHLTKAWHGSEEGLEWHREHGNKTWAERRSVDTTCDHCGKSFTYKSIQQQKFCSNKCKSAWRRASGLDDVDRTCLHCENTFKVNKYSKQKTCSRSCSNRLMWAKRKSVRPEC